jgi:hypothetical protein
MRILRLQFLSRQRATQQDLPTLQPAAPEKAHGAGRTIPAWGMRFLRWLYPDYDIATGADTAIQASAYTANTRFQPDARLSLDMQFVKWLYPEIAFRRPDRKAPPRDRRLAGRLPKPGLVAYYFTGGPPRARDIGNISVTGFYMQTEERWMPGTIIRMTLQLADPRGDEPLDSLTVHSRVVRWGSDGEAFEFVLAGFLDEPLPLSYRRAEPPPRPHDS